MIQILGISAFKGALLILIAWPLAALAHRRSAELSNIIWRAVLISVMALPFFTHVGVDVPLVPRSSPIVAPDRLLWSSAPIHTRLEWSSPMGPKLIPVKRQVEALEPVVQSFNLAVVELWSLYGLGVFAVILRWALSRRRVHLLTRQSQPIQDWDARAQVFLCPEPIGPLTFGSTVLLPQDAVDWPKERRRLVLLHEGAHIARKDCAWQTLADLACAIFWFNPAIWVLSRRLRATAEEAADDATLATGITCSAYAAELLSFVKTKEVYGLGMARRAEIDRRIRRVLASSLNRTPVKAATRLASWSICLLVGGSVAISQISTHPVEDPARVTYPATSENHFTAQFINHHKVRLLALARLDPGGFHEWKPDGESEGLAFAKMDSSWKASSLGDTHLYFKPDDDLTKTTLFVGAWGFVSPPSQTLPSNILVVDVGKRFAPSQVSDLTCALAYGEYETQARLTFSAPNVPEIHRRRRVGSHSDTGQDVCEFQKIVSLGNSKARKIEFDVQGQEQVLVEAKHAPEVSFEYAPMTGFQFDRKQAVVKVSGASPSDSWIDVDLRPLHIETFQSVCWAPPPALAANSSHSSIVANGDPDQISLLRSINHTWQGVRTVYSKINGLRD